MLKIISDALVIGKLQAIPALKNPFQVIFTIVIGLFPVFIISVSGGKTEFAFLGILIAGIAGSGMSVSGDLIQNREFFKFQDILVSSPISPIAYSLGLSFHVIIQVIPAQTIFTAIAIVSGILPLESIPIILIILVISWFCLTMIGFTVGTYMSSLEAGTMSSVLSILLILLPPVYYPLRALPEFLQWVALLIPVTYSAELIRIVTGHQTATFETLVFYWAGLIAWTIIFTLLLLKKAQWRES